MPCKSVAHKATRHPGRVGNSDGLWTRRDTRAAAACRRCAVASVNFDAFQSRDVLVVSLHTFDRKSTCSPTHVFYHTTPGIVR